MSGPCWPPHPRPETCLFGGVCSNTSNVCVCPPGYGPDNILFHNANCALPDGALNGFAIYYSLATFLVILFLVKECRNTINLARRLGGLSLALLIVGWLMVVISTTEGGFYEGLAVLVFTAESLCASLAYHLFLAFVIPLCTIYRIPHKRIKMWMKRWSILLSGPFFAFFVALATFSRRSFETFNWIQAAHCLFILVGNIVFVTALIVHSRNLTSVLSSLSHSNMPTRRLREVQTLERRTRMMTIALAIYLIMVVLCVSALVGMVLVLGSALFGWIFGMIIVHFSLVLGLGVAVFLKQRRDAGDRSSIGIVVERGPQASDVPGDDYMSWSKTNTHTKNLTVKGRVGHDSGVVKGMMSGLGEESMVPITETSDDEGVDNQTLERDKAKNIAHILAVSESDRVAKRDRGVVVQSSQAPSLISTPSLLSAPSLISESDRVVKRDRGVAVQSSQAPSMVETSVKSYHESEVMPRSRAQVISGRYFSTLSSKRSSKRGDVASSVFQSEADTGDWDRTRSSQRKPRGFMGLSRLASAGSQAESQTPDF